MAYGPTNTPGVDGNELEQIKKTAESAVPDSDKGRAGGVATLDESGKVPEEQLPSLCPFVMGSTDPTDKLKLWIDTTDNTGGLKYWNGSAWVHVPVAYT